MAEKEGAALCLAWTLWTNRMFTEGFEVVLRHPLGPLGKASARREEKRSRKLEGVLRPTPRPPPLLRPWLQNQAPPQPGGKGSFEEDPPAGAAVGATGGWEVSPLAKQRQVGGEALFSPSFTEGSCSESCLIWSNLWESNARTIH